MNTSIFMSLIVIVACLIAGFICWIESIVDERKLDSTSETTYDD